MAKTGIPPLPPLPGIDPDFLVTEGSPEHAVVERTVTVKSMPLPQSRIAQVEMIEISEKVIPVNAPAAPKTRQK